MNAFFIRHDPTTGKTVTPFGQFDLNNRENVVRLGLAQLEYYRDSKSFPTTPTLLEDIEAYKYILQNKLWERYLDHKWKNGRDRPAIIAAKLGWVFNKEGE